MDDASLAAALRLEVGRLARRGRAEDDRPQAVTAVLGLLGREGLLTTSQLAVAQRVRPQSMARTVQTLEADGLVERVPDPQDARKRPLTLTARGSAALDHERRRRTDWLRQGLAQALDADERTTVAAAIPLLARIVAWDEHQHRAHDSERESDRR